MGGGVGGGRGMPPDPPKYCSVSSTANSWPFEIIFCSRVVSRSETSLALQLSTICK